MKRLCRTVYTTGARLSFAFIHDPCICTSISTPTHLPGRSFPAHGGELACLLIYSRLFQIHFTHHSLAEHTAPKLYTAGRRDCLLFLTCGLPTSCRQPHSVHCPPGSPHTAHYHLITVTNFTLTICHFLSLSLQTYHLFHKSFPP